MKVSVYKNLLRSGRFSIRLCEGRDKGRVIAYAERVFLSGVVFNVGKAGQHEVRRTGCKNVHAFVTGGLVAWEGDTYGVGTRVLHQHPTGKWGVETLATGVRERGEPFTYNPYRHDGFVSKMDERVVRTASRAVLDIKHGNYAEITS